MGDDLSIGVPDPHDSRRSSYGDRKIRRKSKILVLYKIKWVFNGSKESILVV